jgi:predicted negative regulator of RcsB-dependent stress response
VYQMRDGSIVTTGENGRVKITTPTKEQTLVQLDTGAVELAVTPRIAGDRLEVISGRYRFRVIGTRFRVEQNKNGLRLRVDEGKVAVVENDQILQVVEKGHEWTESVVIDPTATNQPLLKAPPVESRTRTDKGITETNCLLAARQGKHEEALSCFKQQAEGNGVAAEVALYESARIERELLGKPVQALVTLDQYRQRFPEGTLWLETRLLAVQLLVELGKDDKALTESQDLLKSTRAQSRFSELHFLRGKLYRRQGNCTQAINEYAEAAVSTNSQSDRARLERASCLEELGRRKEARMTYEQLSQSTHANLRNEALKRLERLNREEPQ